MEAANVDATTSACPRACWCGGQDLHPYSPLYLVCRACGTLVSCAGLTADEALVRHDDQDFYGKSYWLGHQTDELGLPGIADRARADVADRCAYWLRELLRHRPPPARVLEVGCAHGGFVALARWAGYDATGLEMSPWVVGFARRTFAVPMLQGPVEEQDLPQGSFDAVVLNDVLEHLADPDGTLACCVRLLADDGMLFVQTPCFPEDSSFDDLYTGQDRFVEMMEGKMAREHLYLFSRRSVGLLLARLGLGAVEFLPARFEYDMYLVAGRHALTRSGLETAAATLTASPEGRMKLAWFDLLMDFEAREVDRANRLDQILRLHDMLRQAVQEREGMRGENQRLAAALEEATARRRRGWLGSLGRLLRAG
jgi:2-polyprenyl-3-methyl-5-hydroxy-6-metoxy-1,4-benzoquinol methylase